MKILDRFKFLFGLLIIAMVYTIPSKAQTFNIDDSIAVDILVREFLIGSSCVDVSNIQFAGDPKQAGVFSNLNPLVGITDGIVLSTGHADIMGDQNNESSSSYIYSLSQRPDDPDNDLAALALVSSSNIFDKAMIEFDFVAIDDSFEFEYIFASEEYCDFVGSSFNDVFGFFLSGPGINGPYENNAINIARIPETTQNILINSVNHKTNASYYIDNTKINQGQVGANGDLNCLYTVPLQNGDVSPLQSEGLVTDDFTFDGFTVVLKAKEFVTPGETYHLKIALADVRDPNYDSAVLLKRNSFEAGFPKAFIDDPDQYDCINETMVLTSSASSRGDQFDYRWITSDGGIVSGGDDTTVTINAPGNYGLIVSRGGSACSDTAFTEVTLVGEPPMIIDVRADSINCVRANSNITATVINTDDIHYQIIFPNGASLETPVPPSFTSSFEGQHYYVVVNQLTQCTDTFEFSVVVDTVSPQILLDVLPDTLNCDLSEVNFIPMVNINASASFLWTTSNGSIVSNPTNLNLRADQAGDYSLELINEQNHCRTNRTFTIIENAKTPDPIFPVDTALNCNLAEYTATVSLTDMTDVEIVWYDQSGTEQGTGDSFTTTFPDTYDIVVRDTVSLCDATGSWTLTEDTQRPQVSILNQPVLTCDSPVVWLHANYQGPDAIHDVTTQSGNIVDVDNGELSVQLDRPGTYRFISTTTENGCVDSISHIVLENFDQVLIELDTTFLLDCNQDVVIAPRITPQLNSLMYNLEHIGQNSISISNKDTVLSTEGDFIYHVRNEMNGCRDSIRFNITAIENDYLLDYHEIYRNCQVSRPEVVIDNFMTPYDNQISSGVNFNGNVYQNGDTIDISQGTSDTFSIAIGNLHV